MDELMRHQPLLKADAMKAIIKVMEDPEEIFFSPLCLLFHCSSLFSTESILPLSFHSSLKKVCSRNMRTLTLSLLAFALQVILVGKQFATTNSNFWSILKCDQTPGAISWFTKCKQIIDPCYRPKNKCDLSVLWKIAKNFHSFQFAPVHFVVTCVRGVKITRLKLYQS